MISTTELLGMVGRVDDVPEEALREMWKLRLPAALVGGRNKAHVGDAADVLAAVELDGRTYGFMTDQTVAEMPWSDEFIIDPDNKWICPKGSTADEVNGAFEKVIATAIESGLFPKVLHGKHSEKYRIVGAPGIRIERFATSLFGIAAVTACLIAFVRNADDSIQGVWISERGEEVLSPGQLDVTAAGGVRADQTPWECILQEAREEASLSPDVIKEHAKETGVITYATRYPFTRSPYFVIVHCYAINLTELMTPQPGDPREVAGIELMSVKDIQNAMLRDKFRRGCSLCLIHFFMVHGIIPKNAELERRLHRRLPVPFEEWR
ncbi:hypothetical protein VTI74DRAFT_7484 [Chaetomium olivicolor]